MKADILSLTLMVAVGFILGFLAGVLPFMNLIHSQTL